MALGSRHQRLIRTLLSGRERRASAPLASRASVYALVPASLLLLSACGGYRESRPPSEYAMPPLASRLFTVAYDQISERYVQSVQLSVLTRAGVANLSRLDPKFEAVETGRQLELRENGIPVGILALPSREDDTRRWALFTVAALDMSRTHSPVLRESPPESLYQAIFDGALAKLDGYSRYSGQEAARESRASRDGFGGIGITIDTESGDVRVASIMPNSPAARSAMKVDDRISHVDGESVMGLPAREIVRRLRGPIGRTVNLTLRRAGARDPIAVTLARSLIVPPTVTYRREGNIAHIKLTGFNHRTTDSLAGQLKTAMSEIGPDLAGIILDLRGNLGGLLDQAISVADLFLPHGQIVSTRGRHRASAQSSDAVPGDPGEGVPLVVLVNGSSASASEIVAAALQDNSRAVVVGTTSYGKGSVQTVIPLPNDGELVLTWARFHAPSGYPLQDLGVLPSVCTSGSERSAQAIAEGIRQGGVVQQPAAVLRWRAANHDNLEELKRLRDLCPAETRERDIDLDVARSLLRDKSLYAQALRSVQIAAKAR